MKKQIELTLSTKEVAILQRALVSYKKEMDAKKKKYEEMDTDKYTITETGKEEIITLCETTNRNIAFLYEELIEKTNQAFID